MEPSTAQSLWAVEQRLASREAELRSRFPRIAQLQVELDLLLAVLRRSMEPTCKSVGAVTSLKSL